MPETSKPAAVSPLIRLGVAVAVAAILVVRLQHGLALPQFWAEDGAVFYMNAMSDLPRHGAGFLLTPYQGYLHTIPRILACFSTWMPVVQVPAFFAWSSVAISALVAWVIQSPRIRLGGTWVAALAIAAVPHTGECYGVICNLQWITALVILAVLLMDDAKSKPVRLMEVFALFITGLTGPFVILFMPLFAWRVWQRRTHHSVMLLLSTVAMSLVQLSMLNSSARNDGGAGAFSLFNLWAFDSRRILVSTFAGQVGIAPGISCLVGLLAAALGVWGLVRARAKLPGGLELAAGAAIVVGVASFKLRLDLLPYNDFVDGDRYFYTAKVILVWLVAAGALVAPKPLKAALLALLVVGLVANAKRFVYPVSEDLHWPEYAARIQAGEPVTAPILPKGFNLYYSGRGPSP